MKQEKKKNQVKIGVVVTKESLVEMLNLSKRMANELMTLIDMIQTVANEELIDKKQSSVKG